MKLALLAVRLLWVVQRPSVPLRRIRKPVSLLLTSAQVSVASLVTWLRLPIKLAGAAGAVGSVIAAMLVGLSRVRNILKYTGVFSPIALKLATTRSASTPAFSSKSTLLTTMGRRGDTLMLVLLCLTMVASKLIGLFTACRIKLPVKVCTCIAPTAMASSALISSCVVKCRLGR